MANEELITAPLGTGGPEVSRIGYGAMVLEGLYGNSDDDEAVDTVRAAIDRGLMIDTADAYGNGHNETLVGRALSGRRDNAFVASKFGIVFDERISGSEVPTGWGFSLSVNGTREYVGRAINASLKRLGTDTIDLWYAHYPDPNTPIQDTVAAMSETVSAGKVRYLGLSNVTADQLRAANRVHPISAVQFEYSLWRREAEHELLPACRELGVALVAWSPLGAGFLTGNVRSVGNEDFRAANPRFSSENIGRNRDRFAPLFEIAKEVGVTPAQLALAWLLHQGNDVFAIPGTRKAARIDENARAAQITLDDATLSRIDEVAAPGAASGATLL